MRNIWKLIKSSKLNTSESISEEKISFPFSNLLKDKNVLITGAGRNIGRSIALEMAGNGANIFFTEIDKNRSIKLKEELSGFQVKSAQFISDSSNTDDINTLCNTLINEKINIDILINNTGIQLQKASIKDHDIKRWENIFGTNVFGPVHLTKLITQRMIENHTEGSVIFITSIHQDLVSLSDEYSASKAALAMIIKELAIELAPHNIRVNGIAPGYVSEDENGRPVYHRYTPLNASSINPCYIGRAAVYLSSEYFSKFTTGTIIKIDSGLSLYNHLVDKKMHKRNL